MTFSSLRRFFSGTIAVIALVCLSSCAVPLAPGYQVEKESITVRFVPGNPPHLAIRAEYRLANVGNAPLSYIDVGLPGEKHFGRGNLHVEVDGRAITSQRERGNEPELGVGETAVAETLPAVWQIPFASRWPRGQRRTLVLEYDLAATGATDPRMSIGPNAFCLNDSGWFPGPLEPKALFAKILTRSDPMNFIVDVPADFVATASGRPRGTHKNGSETVHRFRIRKNDPDPFVAAGAYQQQQLPAPGVTVSFWTLQPFPHAVLEQTAKSLAATDRFLATTFGARPRTGESLIVLQMPARGQNSEADSFDNRSVTLPGMILFSPEALSQSVSTAGPPGILEKRLALSWFEHQITPRPESWLLGNSLASYAAMLANEKSGAGPAHDNFVRQSLTRFNQLGNGTVEKPLAFLVSGDPAQQREMGDAKSMLFLFALEDRCGRENLEHALAHMVYALRGQEYGYTDLRAALEQECHKDLSSTFATWLDQKGIPADFRARYENKNQPAN